MVDLLIACWTDIMSYILIFILGMFFMLWLEGGHDDD